MLKKVIWLIILIVIVVVIVTVSKNGKVDEAVNKEAIKIGLSVPLTGDLAFIGEADKNAAMIAMEEIAAQADLKNKYEIVIEDDGFDAQKGASSANKLINVDKVQALISIGSTVGNVFATIAETNKIPHIGMASDANVAKGEYNFINWTRPQEEATAMVAEMKKRSLTKVAIIGVNQQGFQAINADFKEKAKAAGLTIVGDETFNPGQTDFRTLISKIQKTNPEIYLLGAFDPEIGIIVKQMKDLKIKTPITSIESFGLSADQKPFEGNWYIDATEPTGAFNSRYEEKYGKAPGPAAANTYDAIHLLVRAFESASSTNGVDVATALNSIQNYSGALGTLTPGPDGAFISQASVKIIKDGKAEVVK